ncbi:CLUMA_CG011145, isoform A [Clunio marinus]|uniref:CLUMA_CG011145, isoform A n=1 Tax=Clunio marinus TaxID=568069 RepID=A0A1J1IBW1_9DIPT|nr:CLUMA_CG011145, isoform A [Clunio marinus]
MSQGLFCNYPELARKGGFTFHDDRFEEKDKPIDWRFIASIDTTQIIKDSDFEKLDQCIPFLIRSSIGNLLNVRILDPAIAKVYILSQLCLQYLLFCTKFLDKSVYSLRENLYNYQKKTVKLEETITKLEEEIEQLHKKLKRQDQLNHAIFPCSQCTKNFLSKPLLDNHMLRKHSHNSKESKDKDAHLISTIKLELEISQLKEKLNIAESELMECKKQLDDDCEKCRERSKRNFQSIAIQSNLIEEKEIDDVEKETIVELLNNQNKNFERWKANEESRYKSEIDELRNKFDETIETLKNFQKEQSPMPPLPMPRNRVSLESSSTIQASMMQGTDESLWKTRFQELEKKYQEQISSKVFNIERMYDEKISKIEASVKDLKEEKLKSKSIAVQNSISTVPITPNVIKSMSSQPTSTDTSYDSDQTSNDDIGDLKKQFTKGRNNFLSHDSSPQPFKTPHDKIIEVKTPPKEPESSKVKKTFSDQKFILSLKSQKPSGKVESKLQLKKQPTGEEILKQRMKTLGLHHNQEGISQPEFNRVHTQLANERDESKKKHKLFFVTRKKLQSKVDKIFHQKMTIKERNDKDHQLSNEKAIINHEYKMQQVNNELFKKDLERVLENKILMASKQNKENEIPLPTKKKVLFNLDKPHDHKQGQIVDKEESKSEDESDFDVSSFSTDA